MNLDFSRLPLDAPVADLKVEGMQGLFAVVRHLSGQGLTLADVGRRCGESVLVPQLVGTPSDIADQLQVLFEAEACDGFVVTPAHLPHGFEPFVEKVVPQLQARGLFQDRYILNVCPPEIAAAYVWDPALGRIKETGTVLTDSAQVASWGAPTFDAWIA